MTHYYSQLFDIYDKDELYEAIYYLEECLDNLAILEKEPTGPLLFAAAVAAAVMWFKKPQKRPFCHVCNFHPLAEN